jgi:hypothetical protein
MLDSWFYYVGLGALAVLLCLVAPPLLAVRKGYAWYLWTLACGVLGLVVLAFLPYANDPRVVEKVKRSRRRTGNLLGGVLSALSLLGVLPFLALPVLAFLDARSIRESGWVWRFSELLVLMSPSLLVDLGGLVLALVWWRRHPAVSLLTVLAIGMWILLAVGGSFLFAWLPEHLREERGWSFAEARALLNGIAMARNAISAGAGVLLFVALFWGRSPTEASSPQDAEAAHQPRGIKRVTRV